MVQFAPDLEQLRNLQDKVIVLTGCFVYLLRCKFNANFEQVARTELALLLLASSRNAELSLS